MALFELDDIFGYQQANDIKRLWAGGTAPENPGNGEVWLDTSVTPIALKRYNSTTELWEIFAGGIAVDSDGNVGIGTDTPSSTLDIKASAEPALLIIDRTDGAAAQISSGVDKTFVGSRSNHPLNLLVNQLEKMTIDTNGQVGIGTTVPGYPLHVSTTADNAAIVAERTDGVTAYLSGTETHANVGSATSHDLRLLTNAVVRVTVDTSGNVGIGTTSPTKKLDVNGDGTISGTMTVAEQLVIPLNQPSALVNGSIWIA